MTNTSPRITFGLYNLEISSDSSPSATDIQSFSKADDLRTGNVVDYPVATFEPDFWLLDGEYKFMVETEAAVHLGWISQSMSDENGDFAVTPVLTVDFNNIHSSDGLILKFSEATDDFATDITVTYYDLLDNVITSNNYTPDSWEYEIDLVVTNFKKIEIEFSSTNKPYRYLRLKGIDYGQLIEFTGADIKQASVVEEIDQLSMTVPSNSCDLNLYSEDAEFSITNPSGYYARLSERQPLSIYEVIGTKQKFIGRYFLDEWKNTSDTLINFKAVDAIGLLDRIPYRGGLWLWEGIKFQYLVYEIMKVASIPYDIDPDLNDIMIIGWIPQCTCREALQQVAFAAGAYLDCSRSNIVRFIKMAILDGTENTIPITSSDKGIDQSLELKKLVTGVEIIGHNYAEGTESVKLFEGELTAGSFEVLFKEPAHTLTISGAEITESGVNYAIVTVSTAATVILSGLKYEDSQQLFKVENESMGSYVIPNVLKISAATLVNKYNGDEVAQRVYDYYQQRYKQSVRLFAANTEVGDVALVDSLHSSQIRGIVEKQKINLSGGFIIDAEVVGVVE